MSSTLIQPVNTQLCAAENHFHFALEGAANREQLPPRCFYQWLQAAFWEAESKDRACGCMYCLVLYTHLIIYCCTWRLYLNPKMLAGILPLFTIVKVIKVKCILIVEVFSGWGGVGLFFNFNFNFLPFVDMITSPLTVNNF